MGGGFGVESEKKIHFFLVIHMRRTSHFKKWPVLLNICFSFFKVFVGN